ncbi:helix-turn-helix transcriptional regulator [Selenomonas sp. KH1T6]|uniref:helix-turn-helix transcriptional regulator n=1 Tax=Selenomonas sp. KH1T6 TaxID=3158784 RepID=UPI0008A7BAE2|nr:Predicted transcriptional regulator YheO, contains PAS and DNA-binding HTH domains [Selenomonas ruminantium]
MNPILKAYIPVADMLAATFGEECEVVLHDLSDPEHSVVYVANGTVTGREVGQGFEHFVKNAMEKGADSDFVANDFFHKKGKLIRTSSSLIRDGEGNLVGALCINLDMTRMQQQAEYLKNFLPQLQPVIQTEGRGRRVEEMVLSLIDNILSGSDVTSLSREERIEKIRFMESRGIFQLKGSIDQVAERLGVNRVTVYSYLDEVRGKR